MSKLIYAKSKSAFETAFTDLTVTGPVFRSIAFTEDGYLWTHGKYFRIFDATNPFDVTYSNNTVSLKDAAGTELVNFDRGVISVGATSPITATTSNGAVSIVHDASSLVASTIGASAASDTTINVPKIVTDNYGHLITGTTSYVATLNKVKVSASSTNANFYLAFSNASATSNAEELYKVSSVYVNPSTGALYATTLYQGGTALASIYAPIAHASTATTYGVGSDTNYGHLKLSDSTSSTSGVAGGIAATPYAVKTALDAAKAYADGIIAGNDAMVFKGTVGTGGTYTIANFNSLATYNTGWTYRVIEAGTVKGKVCEIGDLLVALVDRAGSGNVDADWTVVQTNIDGAVYSAVTLTENQLVIGGAGSTEVKTLAAGTNGYVLKMVSGAPAWATDSNTWRAIKVTGTQRLADTVSTALDFEQGTGITLGWNGTTNAVTIAFNTSILQALAIQSGGSALGSYSPSGSTNNTINFNGGLSGSLATNVFTIGHSNTITAGSKKLYSFAYDANGHVTGTPSEVTSLANPNALSFFQNDGTTLITTYDGSAVKSIRFVNGTDITMTPSLSGSQVTYTLGQTQRYRPVSFYPTSAGSLTTLFSNTQSNTLVLKPGNANITISNVSNELVISTTDTNTWRNIYAYRSSDNTLAEVLSTSIGTLDLQFGSEFLWDTTNNELKLGWAEVDVAGAVTYSM